MKINDFYFMFHCITHFLHRFFSRALIKSKIGLLSVNTADSTELIANLLFVSDKVTKNYAENKYHLTTWRQYNYFFLTPQ